MERLPGVGEGVCLGVESGESPRKPPKRLWLIAKGALFGVLFPVLFAGVGAVGGATGHSGLGFLAQSMVALGLLAYLNASRKKGGAWVAVLVLSVILALLVPGSAAEAMLLERGELRAVVVTDVHKREQRTGVLYTCSVELLDGTLVNAKATVSCTEFSDPGDQLLMIFDPKGVFSPTDPRAVLPSALDAITIPLILMVLLAVMCFVAVIRSGSCDQPQ